MSNQKPWEGEDLEMEFQETQEPDPVPKYEVVKQFSFGKKKVNPGDELPDGISDGAMESLKRKGVLKTLKE